MKDKKMKKLNAEFVELTMMIRRGSTKSIEELTDLTNKFISVLLEFSASKKNRRYFINTYRTNPETFLLLTGKMLKEPRSFELSRKCYETAKQIAKNYNNMTGMVGSLINLSSLYVDMNEIDNAIKCCNMSLKISEVLRDYSATAMTYSTFSYIYNEQGFSNKSIEALKKAVKFAELSGDHRLMEMFQEDLSSMLNDSPSALLSLNVNWPLKGDFTMKEIVYTGNGGKQWISLPLTSDRAVLNISFLNTNSIEEVLFYYKGTKNDGMIQIDDNNGEYYRNIEI